MGKIVKTVKMVGSLAVSVGIGTVATNVIMAVMPPGAGLVMRGCVKVGTYAISGLASAEAGKQFGRKVDLITNLVGKSMKEIKEEQENVKLEGEEEDKEQTSEKIEYDVNPEDVEV